MTRQAFKVADIYSTKMCPLAKVMRRELKSRDIKSLKVVYSEEKAKKPEIQLYDSENNKPVPEASALCRRLQV